MDTALDRHETLKDMFDREDPQFKIQAISKEAHYGYESWHRQYTLDLTYWLERNPLATRQEFIDELNRVYSLPDMVWRFGKGVFFK